ncbi:MAG: TRAP transporter small permease [Anditalea sp.]
MKGPGLGFLDKILEWAVTLSFMVMIIVVMIQIIARYALPWSPHWTEELARFCFIYMVSLGAGLAIKDRAYVNVTTFLNKFTGKTRFYLDSSILIGILVLMLFMLIYSIPLLKIVSLQNSAALQINMALIYCSMTGMSLFVMLYSLVQLKANFKKFNQPL